MPENCKLQIASLIKLTWVTDNSTMIFGPLSFVGGNRRSCEHQSILILICCSKGDDMGKREYSPKSNVIGGREKVSPRADVETTSNI